MLAQGQTPKVLIAAARREPVMYMPEGSEPQGAVTRPVRAPIWRITMAVFVLDKKKHPLMPCSEKRARLLLERGRAVVVRLHPFTIRLKDRLGGETQPLRLQLDPGSQTTGIALVRESLRHRLDTTLSWVERLQRLAPLTGIHQERVRFDTQAMQNPEISGAWPALPAINAKATSRSSTFSRTTRRCCVASRRRPRRHSGMPTGRGSYQRTRLDRFGFPRGYLTRRKRIHGFQTGDRVRAEVPSGKHAGSHVGRVAVRKTGSFNIQTAQGVVQGISHRHCRVVQRADGYGYCIHPTLTEDARRVA
jgi:hypothetical protein